MTPYANSNGITDGTTPLLEKQFENTAGEKRRPKEFAIDDSPPVQRKRPSRVLAANVKYSCEESESESEAKKKPEEDSELSISEGDLIENSEIGQPDVPRTEV